MQPNDGLKLVFLTLLLFGSIQTLRSFRKEMILARQQKNFLLSITHEFKSPLASIKLYLQTLLKHDLDKDKKNSFINSAIKRETTLFDVLLTGQVANPAVFGNDTLNGEAGDDILYGQSGDDTAHGGVGDDYIEGNAGNDIVFGDAGNDDLIGGSSVANRQDGDDVIWGGTGGASVEPDHDVILGDNGSSVSYYPIPHCPRCLKA